MKEINIDLMIDDYLNGKLSKKALIAFEKQMLVEPELAEKVTISKHLFALYNTDEWEDIKVLNNVGIAYQEYLLSGDAKKIKLAIKTAQNNYKR